MFYGDKTSRPSKLLNEIGMPVVTNHINAMKYEDGETIEAMKLAIEHRPSKPLSRIGMPVTNHIND